MLIINRIKSKQLLFFAGFLLVLNVFCWQEVFVLSLENNLRVDFLDVGQGDAVFIETPQKHQIIIDGGPNSDILKKLSERMPFWDKTIDVLILTHPEKDHMTGLLEILARYKVDYFIWSGIEKNDSENRKLSELLENAGKKRNNFLASFFRSHPTQVITASFGESIKAGDCLFYFLSPISDLSGQEVKNTNDSSVVTKLYFENNSFLFSGDISSVKEKELTGFFDSESLKADVLKIAHHGSKYSTSENFLQKVLPETAVISSGKNSYGHPTPEVLGRLDDFNVKTLRTDEIGDITIISDGSDIFIK